MRTLRLVCCYTVTPQACIGLLWFGLRGVLLPSPDYAGTHEAAQAVLDVTVILFQLPEC